MVYYLPKPKQQRYLGIWGWMYSYGLDRKAWFATKSSILVSLCFDNV